MTDVPESRDRYQILLSNGCNVSVAGYSTPSLAIGYRPSDQSYLLAFQTVSNRRAIACTLSLGAYDWHAVSLIYEDGVLFLRVDGKPCIVSQDFSGDIQTTACPLTIGADPLEGKFLYHGYMDNIVVARYCRRYMDVQENYDDFPGSSDDSTGRRGQSDKPSFQHKGLRRWAELQSFNQLPAASSDKISKKSRHRPAISPFRARIDAEDRRRAVMRNTDNKRIPGNGQDQMSQKSQGLENGGLKINKLNHIDPGRVDDKRDELYHTLYSYSLDSREYDDEEEGKEDVEDEDDSDENDDRWLQESRVGEHGGKNIADVADDDDDDDEGNKKEHGVSGDDAFGWSGLGVNDGGRNELLGSSGSDHWQGDYSEKHSHSELGGDGIASAGRSGINAGKGRSGMDSGGFDSGGRNGRGGCDGKDGHREVRRGENSKENNGDDFVWEERRAEENYKDSDAVNTGNGEDNVDNEEDDDEENIRRNYSWGEKRVEKYDEDDRGAGTVNIEYVDYKDDDEKKEVSNGFIDEEGMKRTSDKRNDDGGDDEVDDEEINKDESVINRVIKHRVTGFRGRYKSRDQTSNMGRETTEKNRKVLWWMRTDRT